MVGLKSPECSNCGNTGPRHSGSKDTLHRAFVMGSADCWAGGQQLGDISTPCFSIRDRLDYSPKFLLTKTVRKSWICEAQLSEVCEAPQSEPLPSNAGSWHIRYKFGVCFLFFLFNRIA